jgi:5-methylcytosine-specific restriction endonuclease McrA
VWLTPLLLRRTSNSLASHRRRAQAAGRRLDYGLDDLRRLVSDSLRLPCRYCGVSMSGATWSCDHATPTSRGGSFALDNLEVICRRCNEAKGRLTREEYSALVLLMWGWGSAARTDVINRLRAGGKALGRRRENGR